ncbi:MAG: helix-turn-helix domain-containing protein [Candidatus Symbiothrix sp.]|jgi:AraC-like DNA-binding protein|nr:helix-turn-helix domain-containing protein [Candidatus Symbiothrix sp.]
MTLFYPDEHFACFNYESDHTNGFKCYSLPAGEVFVLPQGDFHCITFLLSGEAKYIIGDHTFEMQPMQMAFAYRGNSAELHAVTDVEIEVNYFDHPQDLCEKLTLDSLMHISDRASNRSLKPILPIKEPMLNFLTNLNMYLNAKASCKHLHELKQKEMLLIFRFFYTKEEAGTFFSPMISGELDFKALIYSKYRDAPSVSDLARICHYPPASFNRAFRKHFNNSPYNWLQEQRVKVVKSMLIDKRIPFSRIISENGFASPAHFTIYCKKHLHQTPSHYRKVNALIEKKTDVLK